MQKLKHSKNTVHHSISINFKGVSIVQQQQLLEMPKEIIFIEMSDQYPFGEKTQQTQGFKIIQVRKIVQYDQQPRFICKEKIRMLKSLGFQNLIGLESTKSEENAIILIFQHVPFHFDAKVNVLNQEKMRQVKESLLELCQSLASRGIIHEIEVKRVGLDKRFNLKYYLGVDFKIDKSVNKQKLAEKYKAIVCQIILKKSNRTPQMQRLIQRDEKRTSILSEFELDVRNILDQETPPQKKIMKKSRILQFQCSNVSNITNEKDLKASNRFTFNYDNQIRLSINQQNGKKEKKSNCKYKLQDLTARIKILKGNVKELSIKTTPKNYLLINTAKPNESDYNTHSTRTKKYLQTSNFSTFQKKINEFRQIRLRKSSNDHNAFQENGTERTIFSPNQVNPSKNAQKPQIASQTDSKAVKAIEKRLALLDHIAINPITACPSNFTKKNSINCCKNDRQHQEYMMLANKDQYCAQLFLLLDDKKACDARSQRTVKSASQSNRLSVQANSSKAPECEQSKQRENLKTQSSETTLQFQSRVQKVIRMSLKLINGLRSRESIRCE